MRKFYLIALFLMLILLIGVFPQEGVTPKKASGLSGCGNKETIGRVYVGGNQGLVVNFRPEEPPEVVLDEGLEPFTVAFEIKNRGEYNLKEGEASIILSGINTEDFGLQGTVSSSISNNRDPIPGRVKIGNDIVEPASGEILFDSSNGYIVDLEQDFNARIRADICYFYNTEAVSNLCLKYNPIQRRPELDVCRIDSSKSTENSGSPIHFENFRESRSGIREVRFSVDVINVGGGDVFIPEEFRDDTPCIEDLEPNSQERGLVKNYIYVEVIPQSNVYDVTCSRLNSAMNGFVKLVDGKARIDCAVSTERAQDTAFEVPVKMVAVYSYRDFVEKQISVENARIRGLEDTGIGTRYT